MEIDIFLFDYIKVNCVVMLKLYILKVVWLCDMVLKFFFLSFLSYVIRLIEKDEEFVRFLCLYYK